MTDIRQELQEKAKAMGIKLTAQQADQFQTYMGLLLEWNEKINLTAITQPEEVVEKHFLSGTRKSTSPPSPSRKRWWRSTFWTA